MNEKIEIYFAVASPSLKNGRYGGPGRTFGSKLRKSCENGPLALLGQAV